MSMEQRAQLIKMLASGAITKERYDAAVAKLDTKTAARTEYSAKKGKLTVNQRLDIIEKLLELQ